MSNQDSRGCLSFEGSSVPLRSRQSAQRLLLCATLLLVAVTGASAHDFIVIDEQGKETQVPAVSTTQVGLEGAQATIRVRNDGTETGCTTRVTATVQGNAVGFEQVIGPPAATPTTISYDTPPGHVRGYHRQTCQRRDGRGDCQLEDHENEPNLCRR